MFPCCRSCSDTSSLVSLSFSQLSIGLLQIQVVLFRHKLSCSDTSCLVQTQVLWFLSRSASYPSVLFRYKLSYSDTSCLVQTQVLWFLSRSAKHPSVLFRYKLSCSDTILWSLSRSADYPATENSWAEILSPCLQTTAAQTKASLHLPLLPFNVKYFPWTHHVVPSLKTK